MLEPYRDGEGGEVMADEEHVERRLLLSVDARGYGSAPGWLHDGIQQGLLEVLERAAREAGLRRETWHRQPAGDGELAVLPLEEPEVRVVERFPRELKDALFRLNRERSEEARLRLRLAVHFGSAKPGPNGYRHAGPVVVSRLCDSEPLKRMLAVSGADLAVAYSRQIYTDTIQSGLTLLDPGELRQVRAVHKEFDEVAWIWVPGWSAPEDDPGSEGVPEAGAVARGGGVPEPEAVPDARTAPKSWAAPEKAAAEHARRPGQWPSARPADPPRGGAVEHDVYGGSTVPAARPMREFLIDEDG